MSSKIKVYHVDCGAVKVAKFFLMCESHINPDTRIKIPAAMMAKGYSDKESKNRMLQMQVRREVDTRFAWAGGTFFTVVLLCQFLVLAGNRFWFFILMHLEYNTVVVLC